MSSSAPYGHPSTPTGHCPLRMTVEEKIMKTKTLYLASLFLIMITCTTCSTEKIETVETIRENGNAIPVDGLVPNEETAIRIAEAVWLPIYGSLIYGSRPFKARLVDDSIWVVEGTLPEGSVGGTPYAEIQRKDGKVLKVIHGK